MSRLNWLLPLFPALLVGCATPRAQRSYAAVLAADADARAAVQREAQIDAAALPSRSVTVLPFSIASSDTALEPLRFALADLLLTDLSRSASLVVVDRLRTDAMLREVRYLAAAEGAAPTIERFGRLVGAQNVVVGAVGSVTTNRLRLDARLANSVSGAVRAGGGGTSSLDDILEAEKALALEVFTGLDVTLTPAEREKVLQKPTRNLTALLAYGRGVREEILGNYADARKSYREALTLDPQFGDAEGRLEELPVAGQPLDVATGLTTFGVSPIPAPRDAEARDRRPVAGNGTVTGRAPAAGGPASNTGTPRPAGPVTGGDARPNSNAGPGNPLTIVPGSNSPRVEIIVTNRPDGTNRLLPPGGPPTPDRPLGPIVVLPPGSMPAPIDPGFNSSRQTVVIIIPITIP